MGGQCTWLCSGGTTSCEAPGCGSQCVTLDSDAMNCGACGVACAGACRGGQCITPTATVLAPDAGPAPTDGGVDPNVINLSTRNLGTRACSQGGEMVRYAVTALTPTTATVTPVPAAGCVSAGDQVLLMNLQGTATATANVGAYELLTVASVSGGTVTFSTAKANSYGDAPGSDANIGVTSSSQRVMLQRVPVFGTFTSAAVLTADGWLNGAGGVFALRALDRARLAGVDMLGKGFAGAPRTITTSTSGALGETIATPPLLPDGGLGATDDRNSFAAEGGGRGEGPSCGNGSGASGGGAGHATWGGRSRAPCGGRGGAPVGAPTGLDGRALLGSGGSAGGSDDNLSVNPPGGFGGRGGGVVLLFAPDVELTGPVNVSGTSGEGDAPTTNCTGAPNNASTTFCWDQSGPGGGGAGGTVYTSAAALRGLNQVRFRGGAGGLAANLTGTNSGGAGSFGRVWPLPTSCADIHPSNGDGEYLFALSGNSTRLFLAYCHLLGSTVGGMYLTLPAQAGNASVSPATRWAGPGSVGNSVTTRFQRVRFEPSTMRINPFDFTFAQTTGFVIGDATAPPDGILERVERVGYGVAANCESFSSSTASANVDLRGTPFRLSTANLWTPGGFGGTGTSTFSFDRQVAVITGGGFCGDYVNRAFPNLEHELEYFPPRASCQAVKAAYAAAIDIAPFAVSLPELPVLPVTCDLGFDGGGWTLLQASTRLGPSGSLEQVPVLTGVRGHLPMSVARLLANLATRVHVRSAGEASTRSISTVAETTPIRNLRQGLMLTVAPWRSTDHQGVGVTASQLQVNCPSQRLFYPSVYHACSNPNGTHWLDGDSKWVLSSASADAGLARAGGWVTRPRTSARAARGTRPWPRAGPSTGGRPRSTARPWRGSLSPLPRSARSSPP